MQRLSLDRLAGAGDGGDEVVAGHVREAAEVDGVGELGLAGGELLVAAGGDGEGVAGRDGVGHGLPQLDDRRGAGDAWRFTSWERPALAPEVKVTRPRVNQSPAKLPSAGGGEEPRGWRRR